MALSTNKIINRASSFFNLARNSYSTRRGCNRRNLFARISPLGDPDLSVIPVLDEWVREGRTINEFDLKRIIRDLRSSKRFGHALEVSEWMRRKGPFPFSPGDQAVQLDLIGRVHGLNSAETYFNSLTDPEKVDKLYGALLNCYVREGLVEKSLSLMQTMKEMGFASSPINYNDIMTLHLRSGQLEKIPELLSEMKDKGVYPDNVSYRICINSYGAGLDIEGMEKVLEEMENQTNISMDWTTYSMVANFYIKAGNREKALMYLWKCEGKVDKEAIGYNHLISHYANLGNKFEMMRLWGLLKSNCKKQLNRDYITILGCLVKIGELEEAEVLLKEWESACKAYDFRVPNILLIGYSQKGLIEKAEKRLMDMINEGKSPTPNSWAIIAKGYVDKMDMEKGFECMEEALVVQARNKYWRPKWKIIGSIVIWLVKNGKNEEFKQFLSLLKTVPTLDRRVLDALDQAYIEGGKETDEMIEILKCEHNVKNDDVLDENQSVGDCVV